MNIEIEVKDQHLTAKSPRNLVAGTAGLTTFTVSFDENWENLKKALLFESVGGGGQRRTVELLLDRSEGQVPWEVLEKPGTLWISAVGVSNNGVRCPTALMAGPLYIVPSGATVGSPAGERTPELWEQAITAVEKKLDKPPDVPAVGKILKIKSVNEDGTFVCEWANATAGGVTDVTVGDSSIVSNGVASIPTTGYGKYGLVKLDSNGTFNHFRIDKDGSLGINNTDWISSRKQWFSIYSQVNLGMLDKAVKCAMCDGIGDAWTDTERIAALLRMGCTVDDNGFVKWTAQEVVG